MMRAAGPVNRPAESPIAAAHLPVVFGLMGDSLSKLFQNLFNIRPEETKRTITSAVAMFLDHYGT